MMTMVRVSNGTLAAADQLKARLQRLSGQGRGEITRDVQFAVALAAAEAAPDEVLITYLPDEGT